MIKKAPLYQIRFKLLSLFLMGPILSQGQDTIQFEKAYHRIETVIATSGQFKNNKKTGWWEYYNNRGGIGAEGLYKRNQKEGKWSYYVWNHHVNGSILIREEHYQNGLLKGPWVEYSGDLITGTGNYEIIKSASSKKLISVKSGQWLYYDRSQLIKQYSFHQDRATVIQKYNTKGVLSSQSIATDTVGYVYQSFRENGAVWSQGYRDSLERLEGKLISFYPDGEVKEVQFYKTGKKHGVSNMYHQDGAIAISEYFFEGRRRGPSKRFYISGELKELTMYGDNARPYGTKKYYYESGGLKSEGEDYSYTTRKGKWITYYEDTLAVKQITHYNDHGQTIGEEKLFYTDGTNAGSRHWIVYEQKSNFFINQQHGQSIIYYHNGSLAMESIIDSGLIMQETYYRLNADVSRTAVYKQKKYFDGYWNTPVPLPGSYNVFYYENGSIEQEGMLYDDGLSNHEIYDSTWTHYYPDGKIHLVEEYDRGEFLRTIKHLNPDGSAHKADDTETKNTTQESTMEETISLFKQLFPIE